MKTPKIYTTMALIAVTLVWTSCKKEVSQSVIQQPQSNQVRNGGVVEDDPQVVSKVPFIISSALLTQGSDMKGRRPPKPIVNGPDVTPPSVTITSPTQGQTLDAVSMTVAVSASD